MVVETGIKHWSILEHVSFVERFIRKHKIGCANGNLNVMLSILPDAARIRLCELLE